MTEHKSHIGHSRENGTWFVRIYGFESEAEAQAYQASLKPAPAEQTTGLNDLIEKSKAKLAAMSEEERQAMWQAQRESFVRAMTTPCEHGVLDFEQCPQCRAPAPAEQTAGLNDLIEKSKAKLAAMSEEERQAMWQAQRESFVRAMTTPCEHGVLDFEQCPQCIAPAPAKHVVGVEAAWQRYTHGGKPSIWGREVFEAGFRAARAPAPSEHVLAIKPLEWKKVALDSDNWNWLAVAKAETPFGTYSIDKHTKGFLRVMFRGALRVSHFEPGQRAEAEASAQADYEARVRAALSSPMEGGE